MALTGLTEFASQIAIVFTAKIENAANGNLLTISFDIIVAFLAQFLFFQVQYRYLLSGNYICIKFSYVYSKFQDCSVSLEHC